MLGLYVLRGTATDTGTRYGAVCPGCGFAGGTIGSRSEVSSDQQLMMNIIATEALLGRDAHCKNYVRAYREGKLGEVPSLVKV